MTSAVRVPQASPFSKISTRILPALISLIGTVVVLFPNNPSNMTLPSRDSGVFLYVGWRLLMGDVPYRDVWDHKPPLIYFVDALGLALTPASLWGVWLLQFIFIFFTIFLVYRALEHQTGTVPAIAGAIILTSGLLAVLENGNVTEQYALVFQALGIWLFIRAWKDDFPVSASFWIGLCGGMAFNSKQTTIGIWIVYGLVLLAVRFRQKRFPWKDVLVLFAGWILPTLVFALYLASQGALSDFWQQAFLYNFSYIGKHEGIRRLIPVFIKGFLYLSNGWVLYLALAGWISGVVYLWMKRAELLDSRHALILIAVLNLPIEVLFINVSGRSILHYYLTPLPSMAIAAGTVAYTLPFLMEKFLQLDRAIYQRLISAAILAVVLIGQVGQISYYPQYVSNLNQNEYEGVIDYISDNSSAGDQLLMVGAESVVNFLTRREAPTRYVYQYPLALTGSRPMFDEYFTAIMENRPAWIVDTRGKATLTEKLYVQLQKRSPVVRDGIQFLDSNYEPVAQFGDWIVYRLQE